MWIVAVWIVVAITAAIVASNKGRSGAGWFFLCLLLTPLAILPLLALPPLGHPTRDPRATTPLPTLPAHDEKTCPRCAERVKTAAQVCRFCGCDFTPDLARQTDAQAREAYARAWPKPSDTSA